jgi:hypothetical protein
MSHGISDLLKELSPRERFKVAFLEKCAEDGLTTDEMLEKVKTAQARIKQSSFADYAKYMGLGALSAATGLTQSLGDYAVPALLAAPIVGGGVAGHLAATAQEPTDDTVKDIQHDELMNEYKKQTEKLQRERELRNYRAKDSGRGGRPML